MNRFFNNFHFIAATVSVIVLLLASGCSPVSGGDSDGGGGGSTITYHSADDVYSGGAAIDLLHVDSNNATNLNYQLSNLDNSSVYFIFTNTSTSSKASSNPTIINKNSVDIPEQAIERSFSTFPGQTTQTGGIITRSGKDFIDQMNLTAHIETNDTTAGISRSSYPSESFTRTAADSPNSSTQIFYTLDDVLVAPGKYETQVKNVQATCRARIDDGNGKILNIWVADDCWETGGTKTKKVTSTMIAKVAELFLKPEPGNDIYDWTTNIFGAPWGNYPDQFTNFISGTDHANEMTILFYDIDGDNSTSGGVLGYFVSKDNYRQSYFEQSNQRIMIYMDAVLLANDNGVDDAGGDGDTWEYTDFWPAIQMSTLAHELQHLIHFYQKAILQSNGKNSDTWLNEMCSLMMEDLLSQKLGIDGPRGVDFNASGPGTATIYDGRLPGYNYTLYNQDSDSSLTQWNYYGYNIAYSFGAYLMRNFGGAALARTIVQNNKTDHTAVSYALASTASDVDFTTALKKWGAATVLSNRTSGLPSYTYFNKGSVWSDSIVGSVTYRLGSINLYNYGRKNEYGQIQAGTGPVIYSSGSVMSGSGIDAASNVIVKIGDNLTGTKKWEVLLAPGVQLSVLITP